MSFKGVNFVVSANDIDNRGMLEVQQNSGTLALTFFKKENTNNENSKRGKRNIKRYNPNPELTYLLTEFTQVVLTINNPLNITLKGINCKDLSIFFEKEATVDEFFNALKMSISLEQCKYNQNVFLIKDKEKCSESQNISNISIIPDMSEFSIYQRNPSLASIKKTCPGILFINDEHKKEEKKIFTKEDFSKLVDKEGRILDTNVFHQRVYNADIEPSIHGDVFELLFMQNLEEMTFQERSELRDKNLHKYINIKRQWATTTHNQWENAAAFRKIVKNVEKDILELDDYFSSFEHRRNVEETVFNIMMTLTRYDNDKIAYSKGFVKILIPFVFPFIKDIEDGSIVVPEGCETVYKGIDDLESRIFWCFIRFYNDNSIGNTFNKTFYDDTLLSQLPSSIGGLLKDFFPNLLELLNRKNIVSLDFIRVYCSNWFLDCFDVKEIPKLWISAVSFTSVYHFFMSFITSMLFYFAPMINSLSIVSLDQEKNILPFNSHKRDIEISLSVILQNVEKVYEKLKK